MKRILEIRPAEGGDDAKLFCNDLIIAYKKLASKFGWKVVDLGNCQLEITGDDLSRLSNEAGGHRIQRVPPTERRGRVHTSTVTVAVVENSTQSKFTISPDILRISWYSGSGAGGQHRNKHQNSCRITHLPTGITCKAETRNRESSYRDALRALTEILQRKSTLKDHFEKNDIRRGQVGSGMRGDKRRTYRFQDDMVVDHITGKKAGCGQVLNGEMDVLW